MAKAKPPSPHDQARELMRRLKAPDQLTKAMLALLERVQGEATSRERAACIAVAENIEKRWRAASRIGLHDGDAMADAAQDIARRLRAQAGTGERSGKVSKLRNDSD